MSNEQQSFGVCRLRRFRIEDYDALVTLAEADGHAVVAPTHVVEKDGKIVGYLALASIPMVIGWMDTKHTKVRDSLQTLSFIEDVLREHNSPIMAMPCPETSPLYPLVEKLGFVKGGNVQLLYKTLKLN